MIHPGQILKPSCYDSGRGGAIGRDTVERRLDRHGSQIRTRVKHPVWREAGCCFPGRNEDVGPVLSVEQREKFLLISLDIRFRSDIADKERDFADEPAAELVAELGLVIVGEMLEDADQQESRKEQHRNPEGREGCGIQGVGGDEVVRGGCWHERSWS